MPALHSATDAAKSPTPAVIPPDILERAVARLRAGGLVAFPTETVYGLGADAANANAIHALYEAKGRPATRPLTVHLADISEISQWGEITPTAKILIDKFCPGPLTLVLPKRSQVLDMVTAGKPNVGIRLPSHPLARQLIRAFGGGLVAPSANRSGYLSPTTAQHVMEEFGDGPQAPLIIDGGPCDLGIESTIVDCSSDIPRILRLGLLSAELLSDTLGIKLEWKAPSANADGLGHYHPRTSAFSATAAQLQDPAFPLWSSPGEMALLCHSDLHLPKMAGTLSAIRLPDDPMRYAQQLYSHLRYLDARSLAAIIIEEVPSTPGWESINERIRQVCAKTAS